MPKALSLTFVAFAFLASVGTAEAKELSSFRACGAAGCAETRDPALLRPLIHAIEFQGEPVSTRTPSPAPFLRLEFSMRGDDGKGPSFSQYYVPSLGNLAIETNPDAWSWVRAGRLQEIIDQVAAGVKPFPAPRIARVEIGGKLARDPASYTRLFQLRVPSDDYPADGNWKTIRLETARPSPWSTGAATLAYSPSTDVLWRGSEFVKVPSRLAARLEARESLAGATTGGSFPWTALLGGVGAAAIVVPATFLLRRRRAV